VSLSGYNDPIGERHSLAAQSVALRRQNNPYLLLRAYRTPPRLALYFSGESGDGYQAGAALEQVAKPPTSVHVVLLPRSAGGHDMALWRPQVPDVFRWLTQQIGTGTKGAKGFTSSTGSTGVVGSTGSRGSLPRSPSNDGATRAALASGSASRAGAGQKR
jgi:hypothetical protein